MTTADPCRNGDKLDDLEAQYEEAAKAMNEARVKLERAESALQPLREDVRVKESRVFNFQTRISVWWAEYRSKQK